ncbi:hypothetical protein ONS95_005791 [Cadophora gregata]|uniref:uncharacterized protein n=1 Tax=Cadophora gregata TaxID=51156 RepID=UPI0026DB64A7|nr:uncharacterized protein ONS95_005791 [Cadophora gregata]KAK0103789.1 hypothetical protein ONS95_005791 [Cadophora gregata]KAK0107976.1 hypothetical protein ONS96_003758 [Cadophora gregata f. sp. sojae]
MEPMSRFGGGCAVWPTRCGARSGTSSPCATKCEENGRLWRKAGVEVMGCLLVMLPCCAPGLLLGEAAIHSLHHAGCLLWQRADAGDSLGTFQQWDGSMAMDILIVW